MTRILDPFLKIHHAIIVNFDSKLSTTTYSLRDTIKPHNYPYIIIHSLTYSYIFYFFPEANMNVSFGYNDSDGLLGKDDQGQFIEFITEAQCFVLESPSN